MIVVAGTIQLDPEKRDTAAKAATEMMAATRQEAGCISYTFSNDLNDPGGFLVFEEWESPAALDAHMATPHMASFRAAMAGFGIKAIDVKRYEVSGVGPMGG